MTAHKRKEWYIVAKNKRLTNKEKQARAELKKRMQDKGVLPPDKPKLNRKVKALVNTFLLQLRCIGVCLEVLYLCPDAKLWRFETVSCLSVLCHSHTTEIIL